MIIEPDQIRARIETLLTELVELPAEADSGDIDNLDELARRLEEAHDLLVHALESVEKG